MINLHPGPGFQQLPLYYFELKISTNITKGGHAVLYKNLQKTKNSQLSWIVGYSYIQLPGLKYTPVWQQDHKFYSGFKLRSCMDISLSFKTKIDENF